MDSSKSHKILVLADTLRQKPLTKKEIAKIIDTDNNQNVLNYCRTLTRAYGDDFYIVPSTESGEDRYHLKSDAVASF